MGKSRGVYFHCKFFSYDQSGKNHICQGADAAGKIKKKKKKAKAHKQGPSQEFGIYGEIAGRP